jgi:hypothetical protein
VPYQLLEIVHLSREYLAGIGGRHLPGLEAVQRGLGAGRKRHGPDYQQGDKKFPHRSFLPFVDGKKKGLRGALARAASASPLQAYPICSGLQLSSSGLLNHVEENRPIAKGG